MIIRDHLSGDVMNDLAQMSKESQDRRTEPADGLEFLNWVAESLRLHRKTYDELANEWALLKKADSDATIGLKRLEALVVYFNRDELEHLQEMHRTFVHNNWGIGYTLERCKKILAETTTNYQLVGETLVQPLADRHKKKGVQQELGLRLRDIDEYYERLKNDIESQKKLNIQLAEGIQKLMNIASIKLPPHVKQQMNREDQIKKLATEYQVDLKKGKDFINPSVAARAGAGKLKQYGDANEGGSQDITITPTSDKTEPATNYVYAGLALAAGAMVGLVLFS